MIIFCSNKYELGLRQFSNSIRKFLTHISTSPQHRTVTKRRHENRVKLYSNIIQQLQKALIQALKQLRYFTCRLKHVVTMPLHAPVRCLSITPGNTHLLAGLADGKLIIIGVGKKPEPKSS